MINVPDLRNIYDTSVPGHFSTAEFVFFWAGPFSNWHPSPFLMKNSYPTQDAPYDYYPVNCSEQAMMYEKAIFFEDYSTANKILKTADPAGQKRLGRSIKNYSEDNWVKVRRSIVRELLLRKFAQNKDLLDILLDTGDKIIVEASPYDTVWGIGMGVDKWPDIGDPNKWKGQNILGECLMDVREALSDSDTLAEYLREYEQYRR